jgi:hypothetical protein
LQEVYGWAITYEDLPLVYSGDLMDVTSQVRRDGKSASEPGVKQILVARGGAFSFSFDPPSKLEPGTRAPEGLARTAILDMLKSYSASIGDVETFTLTDSNGLFHIVPTQRKDESGKFQKIVPLLDTVVDLPPGERSGYELLMEICQSLTKQTGIRVGGPGGGSNLLSTRKTRIASQPNESAQSILSRLFAEVAMPKPASWHMYYQGGSYAVNVFIVNVRK